MEPTSWGGSYRSGADAAWEDATMWIEDGDLGVGLTGSWTIVPATVLTDVVSVRSVGDDDRGTELEITLVAGRTFSLVGPKGFVDELIGALHGGTVLDLTEPSPPAPPATAVSSGDDRPAPLLPRAAVAIPLASAATAVEPIRSRPSAAEADGMRCDVCGVLCLTLADLRDHELVHQPRVEFVPFPST